MMSHYQGWYTLEHVAGKSASFPIGSHDNRDLVKISGRFLKNMNFPPPPDLPSVFIFIVFVLEYLGDRGFCSQNCIYSRDILWWRGDNSKLKKNIIEHQ